MRERPPAHPILVSLQEKVDANCRRCGKCCLNSRPISVRDPELFRISRFLGIPSAEARERFFARAPNRQLVLKEPCPFLEERGCRIYAVRPRTCREFPFLSDVSRAAFARHSTVISTSYCPASVEAVAELRERVAKETGWAPKETRARKQAATIDEELAEIEALKEG